MISATPPRQTPTRTERPHRPRRGTRYGPVASCPTCESEAFHPLATDGCCSFRCESCGTEWQYELGHLLVR